jgi:hypothetical protein
MRVRLGFSVAVHMEPEVLLIDEVLAVGDQNFRHKCLLKVKSMQRKRMTIVLVSHNMEQVSNVCERVIWLDQGQLEVVGKPEAVIEDYIEASASEEQKLRSKVLSSLRSNEEITERIGTTNIPIKRWGSGDIIVNAVRLLGSEGRAANTFHPDDPMRIEFDYTVNKSVASFPSFGIAIYRIDGLWCYGTNTGLDKCCFPQSTLPSTGTVAAELSTLQLLGGDYTIDIAIHDINNDDMYDYVKNGLCFKVVNKTGDRGVFRPELHWHLSTKPRSSH